MLDNLINPTLSGLTGNIQYSTADLMMPNAIMAVGSLVLILALITGLFCIFSTSKTKKYRERLSDMYVAGTIRNLSKKDCIDLDEEYKVFLKQQKKKYLEEKRIDDVVEVELSEKIIDEQEKALKKSKLK
jgi:hypothetical protein